MTNNTSNDVNDFSTLNEVIKGKKTPINITNTVINWPADSSLIINYKATFTTSLSTIVFDGQGQSSLFRVMSTTLLGDGRGSSFTFQNAIQNQIEDQQGGGGAIATVNTTITFNNPTIFYENTAAVSGGGFHISGSTVIFNDTAAFTGNSAHYFGVKGNQGSGGGIYIIDRSSVTFNKPVLLDGNSGLSKDYGGGAIYIHPRRNPSVIFHDLVILNNNITPNGSGGAIFVYNQVAMSFNGGASFINNSAGANGGAIYQVPFPNFTGVGTLTFNHMTTFAGNKTQGSGGAVYTDGIITFNDTVTFANNSATKNGGAIHLAGDTANVTLNATKPLAPMQFSGNSPQAVYFDGGGQLTMNTESGTTINMRDAIASANDKATINKQGSGTWRQSGDSSSYKGTTNVTTGSLRLEPGAVYGNTTSGTFTLGSEGTLAFSSTDGNTLPLLQASRINLNGGITALGLIEPGEKTVIVSNTPILVNGVSFSAGDALNQGQTLSYNWQFVFASPTEVVLKVQKK